MPVVICDTSPIHALARLALVDLLAQLYGQVLVPPAVEWELANPPSSLPAVNVSSFPFVQVRTPQDQSRVQALRRQALDPGESEALALALEFPTGTLIVDETPARHIARGLGLRITGTLGVLLLAKTGRLIPAVKPLVDRLQNDINFFVAPQLRAQVLRLAGEQP